MAGLTDPFGRRIDYLRLSVTDRCNLRCVYCLPAFYDAFSPLGEVLTDDEVVRLAGVFTGLGFTKIRVTGGEPLVRPGIVPLLARIAALPGLRDLALSTNGTNLLPLSDGLAAAGLKRINVSVDSLDPARFKAITRRGRLDDVMAGLERAMLLGLSPVKVNVVVARGMNEDEVAAFAELTVRRPLHVRFIELMPMGETGFFSDDKRVPLEEMMSLAGPLEPCDGPVGNGPARHFRRPGAKGTVGFISAVSCGFCQACNRVRLSARGKLIPCLDGEEGADLRGPLRAGATDEELRGLVRAVVAAKPERHFMAERAAAQGAYAAAPAARPRFMCQVGG
jgi:GTP 3',8-cyclase